MFEINSCFQCAFYFYRPVYIFRNIFYDFFLQVKQEEERKKIRAAFFSSLSTAIDEEY